MGNRAITTVTGPGAVQIANAVSFAIVALAVAGAGYLLTRD